MLSLAKPASGLQSTQRPIPDFAVNRPAPQFSLAHLTMLQCSPPELTEIAARAGYDFVSFRPIGLGLPGEPEHALGADHALFKRTQAALRATGVRLLDIELARIIDGVDISSYKPALEAAAALGGRHVLTSVWCQNDELALTKFINLCELAQPLGLTVDLEFVTFAQVGTFAEALAMVSASRCSNAGICVDTLHFDRGGSSLQELVNAPRRYFHYAQICDAPAHYGRDIEALKQVARDGRLNLGEGGIKNREILSGMPQIPYSIEIPNSRRLADMGPQLYARACLVAAQRELVSPLRPLSAA